MLVGSTSGLIMSESGSDFDSVLGDAGAAPSGEAGAVPPMLLPNQRRRRRQLADFGPIVIMLVVASAAGMYAEPFAALDAQSRRLLQRQISDLWMSKGGTYIYVTHDIREAVILAERVGVMKAGPKSGFLNIHEIDLPYPRDEYSLEFSKIARIIEKEIVDEVNKLRGL